jgi:dipeptide/tripeptide permease
MIIKKSIKYPIIFMSGYLAVQSFLLFNIVLYATHPVAQGGLGQDPKWANAIYAVAWSLQAILAIFVIKWFAKYGYKEGLVVSMMFQTTGFLLLAIPTTVFFIIGACCWSAGASLSVSQNYVVLSDTMTPEHEGRNNIFLLLYAIMNAAAFGAGILSGFSSTIGFAAVFLCSAGLAFIILLFLIFFYNPKVKAMEGTVCYDQNMRSKPVKFSGFIKLIFVGLGVMVIMICCCFIAEIINAVVALSVVGIFVYLIILTLSHKGAERVKILTFTIIMLITLVYWAGYNIYTATGFVSLLDTATNLHGLGVQDYLAVDAGTIIVFGLPLVLLLIHLEKKGIHFNAAMRVVIGMTFLGIAFCIPVIGFHVADFGKINGYFMILTIIFCGFGETFIGPVGAAVAGHCATKKLSGIFMAFTFVIVSGSAAISTYWADWMIDAPNKTVNSITHQFSYTIGMFAVLAFVCAIIVLILYKPLVRWGHFTKFKESEEVPQLGIK